MAMGVVDNDLFETELNKSQTMKSLIIDAPVNGRGNNKEVPEVVRQIIGEDAIENGSKASLEDGLAKYFDVSPSSVSAYKNGDTTTSRYDQDKSPNLKSKIRLKKDRIVDSALNGIEETLNELLTGNKLENVKPVELASIARNLSGLVKDFDSSDESEKNNNPNNQIIIYAPKLISDERFNQKYDTIDLQET